MFKLPVLIHLALVSAVVSSCSRRNTYFFFFIQIIPTRACLTSMSAEQFVPPFGVFGVFSARTHVTGRFADVIFRNTGA